MKEWNCNAGSAKLFLRIYLFFAVSPSKWLTYFIHFFTYLLMYNVGLCSDVCIMQTITNNNNDNDNNVKAKKTEKTNIKSKTGRGLR